MHMHSNAIYCTLTSHFSYISIKINYLLQIRSFSKYHCFKEFLIILQINSSIQIIYTDTKQKNSNYISIIIMNDKEIVFLLFLLFFSPNNNFFKINFISFIKSKIGLNTNIYKLTQV